MQADAEPQERDEEDIRVFYWRVACFLDLGLTLRQARRLANAHVDWHRAEHLLEDGCPADLLVRILI